MSTSAEEETQIRDAGPPFAAPDADIILLSTDGVRFRTHKSSLTRTLHGFDEILRDGNVPGLGSAEEVHDGLQVIPLPESSAVLDLFLRTLLPAELGCPPLVNKLKLLSGVCKALNKYIVKNFPQSVHDALLQAAVEKPERVYATTCPYSSLSNVTRAAAKITLLNPRHLDNLPYSAVAEMSALQYHALAKYQSACRLAAASAANPESVRGTSTDTPGIEFQGYCTCQQCSEWITLDLVCETKTGESYIEEMAYQLPLWLEQYLDRVYEVLQKGPRIRGDVALDENYLAAAIDASKECPGCSKDVAKFLGFARRLEGWIDERIKDVQLDDHALVA